MADENAFESEMFSGHDVSVVVVFLTRDEDRKQKDREKEKPKNYDVKIRRPWDKKKVE
jgi:hypothetical protein